MTKAGQRLIGAAKEALAIARGEAEPAGIYIPADVNVKAIRNITGLTQSDFAGSFGFTVSQIRDWEQKRNRPTGHARAYLLLIAQDPKSIAEMLRAATRAAA